MALKAVSVVERRLEVLLEPERTGETVEQVCRRNGISRDTYYRYRRRYLQDGVEGLEDRSRRPLVSPAQIDADLEVRICRMRKDHPRWGARRIQAELSRKGVEVPAVSTIHQALRRNHLVAAQPPRRPKALKRFEREISNDLWQMDATQVRLTNQRKVWVLDTIDDHSRYLLAAVAAEAPTGEAAWDCFEEAASRFGLPRQVLTDNGMCFTGRLHQVEVAFERSLAELGVELITAGPYHPQTLGKLERFHRTLKQWLADEGPAYDLPHLQELLDAFRHHYNRERPHQGIGNLTPAERYRWRPPGRGLASVGGVLGERGTGVPPAFHRAQGHEGRQHRVRLQAHPSGESVGRCDGPGDPRRRAHPHLLRRRSREGPRHRSLPLQPSVGKGGEPANDCQIGFRYAVSGISPERSGKSVVHWVG